MRLRAYSASLYLEIEDKRKLANEAGVFTSWYYMLMHATRERQTLWNSNSSSERGIRKKTFRNMICSKDRCYSLLTYVVLFADPDCCCSAVSYKSNIKSNTTIRSKAKSIWANDTKHIKNCWSRISRKRLPTYVMTSKIIEFHALVVGNSAVNLDMHKLCALVVNGNHA